MGSRDMRAMNGSGCAAMAGPLVMQRDAATWYGYLLLGFFTFLLNIQGNILPFLQRELALGYGLVALHSSAIAAGMIVTGLTGERVIGRLGQRPTLAIGGIGAATGGLLLCLAPAAWASIAACFVLGLAGSLIPSVVPAMLADIHRQHRDRALAELSAVCYVFAVMAPLAMGASLALGLGWRGAVLAGVVIGLSILVVGRRAAIPDAPPVPPAAGRLPVAYWAYWLLLALVVAIEFCVLLWAPAFLERVVGLAPATAASTAAVFALAMLAGRLAGSALVGRIPPPRLYATSLVVTILGFALYWGGGSLWIAVPGLAVIGLGVALLYPLSLGLALEAAGPRGAAASARFMFAVGLAILTAPFLLGAVADRVGLANAHLVIPALAAAALLGLAVAQRLAQRPAIG
jgi:MFS transporter, DHA1 family, inner membrane transport protein